MKVTFLGGAEEVGASGILVEAAGLRILVDCGIRPSPRAHAGLAPDQLPGLSLLESGSGGLDAVLVTHAHTDHTGALELVLERYPQIPVYATAPTLALTRVLHQDSRRIMQSRLDEEGELPLFDDLAVQRLVAAMVPVPFKTRVPLSDQLSATFFPAGHIAGAAMIGLECAEGRLLISGDFSVSPQRTVDGARPPAFHPDFFIVESTYGGRLHANRAVEERKLVEAVAQVTAAGGKVLIPAFALGRAQEVLLILSEYQRRGELPAAPVSADGMVRAICQCYPSFGEALPLALQEQGAQFFHDQVRPVTSASQRNAILWNPGPAVIVASSGMLAGGPSLSYARALATQAANAILLTGYQDEESPGRRLQELAGHGSGTLRLGPDKIDVQCRIASYSLSAHADESQIINLVETLDPQQVILVHGDTAARASLEAALSARQRSVRLPQAGQTIELRLENPAKYMRPDSLNDLPARQAELNRLRGAQMTALAGAAGQWLRLKGQENHPVRCLSLAADHLWVEVAPGLEQAVYPEAVLSLLGTDLPAPQKPAAASQASPAHPALFEPNQALAAANAHFPPAARLRKAGYRLAEHTLLLTFDFPDAAPQQFAAEIAALAQVTGWKIKIDAETNQAALNALARELLPADWRITKGPAIYRDQKRVALSAAAPKQTAETPEAISHRFQEISAWELDLNLSISAPAQAPLPARSGERLEINAAYAFLKAALEGSTLYRTSLKDGEIQLSFISPQVAARYQDRLADLSAQVGWPLSVNPQPNQGAIADSARVLAAQAGLTILKGPSIYSDKAELSLTLSAPLAAEQQDSLCQAFLLATGYRLNIAAAPAPPAAPTAPAAARAVEIPLNRIRLNAHQQSLTLDPGRVEKAVQRARVMGIQPPIQVRRVRDGYILIDGLYRLRAAEVLGMERIPAEVE